MKNFFYGECVSQMGERLKVANEFLGDTTRALLEDHPEDAVAALQQAQVVVVGALALAHWAVRMKEEEEEEANQ